MLRIDYARLERLNSVVCQDVHAFLMQDRAGVILVGCEVKREARLALAGAEDGLVHVMAVHALAPESGEERGVNVDHAARPARA